MATQSPEPPTEGDTAQPQSAGPAGVKQDGKPPRSRAGAIWVGVCVAALVLIALLIFMLQNLQPVVVTFLSMQATVPLAAAVFIAGIGVGIVALVIGTIRISQLRRQLSQQRQTR